MAANRVVRGVLVLVLGVAGVLVSPLGGRAGPVAAAPDVVVTDLGTLGGSGSTARDVNDAGVVVGSSQKSGDAVIRAFRWTRSGGMQGLGTLGGPNSEAEAINAAGQIVGWSDVAGGARHAFVWQASTGMRDLGTLGGAGSEAVAINDRGVVVGMSDTQAGTTRAFGWDAAHGIRDLGLPDGYSVWDVNDSGLIVGSGGTAFVWDPVTGVHDLGTLGGSSSGARAINASGQVAGWADDPVRGPDVGVLWSAAGVPRSIGTLPSSGPWTEGCCSGALDVNDAGVVVGYGLVDGDDVSRAVVWNAASGLRDLGTLGGEDATAYAINATGTIAGESIVAGTGHQHAAVWQLAVDATPPVVTCGPRPTFALHQRGAMVMAAVSDTGSGPKSATVSVAADTSSVGWREVSLVGADNAGNTSSITCRYKVVYKMPGGFFRAPIDEWMVNVARAGKVVPVRFRITDAYGVPVATLAGVHVAAPVSAADPAAPTDAIEWYVTTPHALRYLGDGTYQYDWATARGWAGTTRTLQVDLGEGRLHTTTFRFVGE
ncbi:MAG: PxKF domain-containing protein [Actinobacteria bacterium]|nr:PxKF domain-containing protein [Actinomycetota bacterium]